MQHNKQQFSHSQSVSCCCKQTLDCQLIRHPVVSVITARSSTAHYCLVTCIQRSSHLWLIWPSMVLLGERLSKASMLGQQRRTVLQPADRLKACLKLLCVSKLDPGAAHTEQSTAGTIAAKKLGKSAYLQG